MKKYLLVSLIVVAAVLAARPTQAKETVEVFYFYESGCPSCQSMNDTLAGFKNKYSIILATFDVSTDTDNRAIFEDLLTLYQMPSRQTPTVFVGKNVYVGYSAAITSEIENTIIQCQAVRCDSPQQALDQYYEYLAHPEQESSNGLQKKSTLYLTIFMIVWPLLGATAIVIVIKKYRKK
ncbi:MAG: conjugal transfer protein TraF [Patescibacteria group bacterium]